MKNQNQIPPTVKIDARGLPDAWYKAIKECLKQGALKRREYGLTKDMISLIEISDPLQEPLLHPDFPTKELHLREYIKQFERGYDWKGQGHEYNYVDRLINYPRTDLNSDNTGYYKYKERLSTNTIDQIKEIREKIADSFGKGKGKGKEDCIVSNRHQAVTWVVERDSFVNEDQPCLQRVQIFVYSFPEGDGDKVKFGKGEFVLSWRSRDLYAAWNSNMIAMTHFLKKEIFDPNNIRIVRIVDFSSSLHIYESDWDAAGKVRPTIIDPRFMR